MIYFTSDLHFRHKNIIRYCNRPFSDITEMEEILITNWNKVVSETDTVYSLGDFTMKGIVTYQEILSRLNGYIFLIKGNHDFRNLTKFKSEIEEQFPKIKVLGTSAYIKYNNVHLFLTHFPLLSFHYNSINDVYLNLHGHIHSGPNSQFVYPVGYDCEKLSYDVGVDNNNYFPISLNDILIKKNYGEYL